MAVDVYHEGERAAQRRSGLLDQGGFSARAIQHAIPAVARDFLARQVMLVLGATDAEGRVWATLLSGPPGFLRAEDDTTLAVAALPAPGDPLRSRLGEPAPVGMLAIEASSRRRMRMNGRSTPVAGGLRVALEQVYANCPKYIQKREPHPEQAAPGEPVTSAALSPDQRELLSRADTFFVATADRDGDADASHRGGNPGFVQVLSDTTLRWPDYVGNAMFNTLGNLEVNPAAGLLFQDWATGTTLQLTGTARTDWGPAAAGSLPGAQRVVDFTVSAVVEIPSASRLRWSAPAFSRFNPPLPTAS
ncbi:pyridoxamine 5'-phosphate oxidase family protein [Amycolatopsis sp. ATCC 39116]|uniref:pyridoxamine 5'-phosphate oxidase family protein n=1 Tax=Amycolatopsis sp. (strain ATCC 39116 / 75iv2) TaxID=385957 RepID=UPI00026290F7|nr:pyridoxamine 5'-phosphate oxidase family protein [Amycolatopsis sp. ATCC 39116]